MDIDLIYSIGDNNRFEQIGIAEGYALGVRSDRKSYSSVMFVDQPYKNPNFTFEEHLARVAKEQPKYATVPDLPSPDLFFDYQLDLEIKRVIAQADRLANYCRYPLIIPKWPGQLAFIHNRYAIGYSIPTSYGGSQIDFDELKGRKVHLLGGRPVSQLYCYRRIQACGGRVVSCDSNAFQVDAKKGDYFDGHRFVNNPNKTKGFFHENLHLSLQGIKKMWERELTQNEFSAA